MSSQEENKGSDNEEESKNPFLAAFKTALNNPTLIKKLSESVIQNIFKLPNKDQSGPYESYKTSLVSKQRLEQKRKTTYSDDEKEIEKNEENTKTKNKNKYINKNNKENDITDSEEEQEKEKKIEKINKKNNREKDTTDSEEKNDKIKKNAKIKKKGKKRINTKN